MEAALHTPLVRAAVIDAGRRWSGGDGVFRAAPGLTLAVGGAPPPEPLTGLVDALWVARGDAPGPEGHGSLALLRLELGEELLRTTHARLRARRAGDAPLASLPTVRLRLGEATLALAEARESLGGHDGAAHARIDRATELAAELHGGSSCLEGSVGDLLTLSTLLALPATTTEETP